MDRPALLLSIRQEHATAILDGTKTYEFRRVRPKVQQGDTVLLYVTAPVSAICGSFEVDAVLNGSATHIWQEVRNTAGISRRQLQEYLAGARSPCALRVRNVQRFSVPVTQKAIRKVWAEFRPPQSYRYVPFKKAQRMGLNAG